MALSFLRANLFGTAAIAGMALALCAPQAQAQTKPSTLTPGYYVGLKGGVNFLEDINFGNLAGAANNRATYDTGAVGLLSGGYKYGNGLRTELEFGYRTNDNGGAFGVGKGGSSDTKTFFLNGLYDFNTGGALTPYLGLGAGIANVNHDRVGVGTTFVNGDDVSFAYQGIAGVSYPLTRNLLLDLDYRYLGTTSERFDRSVAGVAGKSEAEYHSHAVTVGIRWAFGAPETPAAPAPIPVAAPQPPAPLPPPPPPAPAPITAPEFVVYFGFDKSDLDDKATTVVNDVVAYSRSHGETRLALAGHTDLAGSPDYNMRLSLRRADAVRSALIKSGISADRITVTALGESQPAVPTAQGVREALNCRVVIDIR